MQQNFEIVIPQYIREYKVSNKRRRAFYKESSRTPVPKKYQGERFIFKDGKLWDATEKDYVTKNPGKAGKPRYQAISANLVWGKMDQFERKKMVEQIKRSFLPHVTPHEQAFKQLRFPIQMECEVHTLPGYCGWDLSNFWIYTKVLEDLLKTDDPAEAEYMNSRNPDRVPGLGYIPDDSILYVTKAASPRFIPVSREEDRKLIYRFTPDRDERITTHLMYNLVPRPPVFLEEAADVETWTSDKMWFVITTEGATGNYIIDMNERRITANVGKKKIIAGEVSTALNRLFWDCINLNTGIVMFEETFIKFESFISKFLLQKGIPVYVCRVPKV